jgi:hypothetical protein
MSTFAATWWDQRRHPPGPGRPDASLRLKDENLLIWIEDDSEVHNSIASVHPARTLFVRVDSRDRRARRGARSRN